MPVSSPGARRRRPGPSLAAERPPTPLTSTAGTALPTWSPPPRRAVAAWPKHDEKLSLDFDLRGSAYPTSADVVRYSSFVNSPRRFGLNRFSPIPIYDVEWGMCNFIVAFRWNCISVLHLFLYRPILRRIMACPLNLTPSIDRLRVPIHY